MICQLLENASKVDPNEDVLTNCFMAHARVRVRIVNDYLNVNSKLDKRYPY